MEPIIGIWVAFFVLILWAVGTVILVLRRRGTQTAMAPDVPIGYAQCRNGADWVLNKKAQEFFHLSGSGAVAAETLASAVDDDTKAAFLRALRSLVAAGEAFETNVGSGGRTFSIYGIKEPKAVALWIQDTSATTWLTAQYAEKELESDVLRAVLNAVPMPIWWRDASSLELIGSNASFKECFGENASTAESDRARELAHLAQRTGVPQSESRALVRDGYRRSYDFAEIPLTQLSGFLAGMAKDVSPLEELQSTLAEHIAVQDQVLERLTAAIAIFGPDRRIKFFNKPYADMWRLPVTFLEDQPTLSTLMETLREKQQLPETSDFPAFKRDWEAMFTDLLEPSDFLLHLPDGRTLRAIVSPHPLGGLIFQFDDVTDRLALESTRQTLIAVQRSTLNAVFEGVCAFGRDGRLRLYNDAFVALFDLDAEWLATEPHVNEVADQTQAKLQPAEDLHGHRDRYVMTVLEPTRQSGRLTMLDGRVIEYAFVPLPDGQCLILYLDITDSTQVEEALRDRNRALENADLLKSRFISNMSYELRTPLNAIMGFAELLKLQAVGPLEQRQQGYVEDILLAARFLADLIGNILDLAALQAGYLEFDTRETDLSPSISKAISGAVDTRNSDPNRIHFVAEPEPLLVSADPKRLHQALHHLIVDALNYAESGTEIAVTATTGPNGGAVLSVTVPALEVGLPPWPRRALEQSDSSVSANPLATSSDLGLSLFRALIMAHGGTLSAEEGSNTLVCAFPPVDQA